MKYNLIPKVLSIIYIIFISLFAFDTPIFSFGFLIHLIPNFLLIIILIFSWKNEKFGAIAFLIMGLIFTLFFNTYREVMPFLLISLPLFIIGILFWVTKKRKTKKRRK